MKKSKILLGKAGILKEEEEEIEVQSGNCKDGKQEDISIDFIIIHACVDSFQAYMFWVPDVYICAIFV